MLQLQDNIDNFVLQLEGTPPHWSANVRNYLNKHLPHQWIGRVTDYNKPLTQWPTRSSDLTFFNLPQWG
ncbi:hypothetical protein TNCV_50061 [Trichonephila clavipes]|nr:hypothetical protein TNCV_50061 [Trichonephila clavipes]